MSNSYFIDTSSDFKAHAGEGWRVFGPSKTTEELRKSIDILSERLKTEKQLNERLDRENTQWEGEVDKLKERLSHAEHNLEALELQLRISRQEAAAHKSRCEQYEAACDLLRKERSDLESKNEALMRQKDMYLKEVERRREQNVFLQKELRLSLNQ